MLLKDLSQLFGVSGYETAVRQFILGHVTDYADDTMVDSLGNLIVFKKGCGANKKRIMMAAHMDEIGLQILKIDDRGIIKFVQLGTLFYHTTYMSRVKFRNGITGIISNVADVGDGGGMGKFNIEIGTSSKTEALEHVKVGDTACYVGEYIELLGNKVTAKALDDRVGCYILIEAIKKVTEPYNDLYFVFTVQEEVGCRGSKTAAARIGPDIGIAVDITPAGDYPCSPNEGNNTLGAGVCIKVSDPSVICDEYLVREMVSCCEENGIKHQFDVINRGGTDAGEMNRSGYGVRAGGISVAARYPHGPNAVVDLTDIKNALALLVNYTNREFAL